MELLAHEAGAETPPLGVIPPWMMRGLGLVHRISHELAEVSYQLEQPFVMSSEAGQARLGPAPTPHEEIARLTVAWWREQLAPTAASGAAA